MSDEAGGPPPAPRPAAPPPPAPAAVPDPVRAPGAASGLDHLIPARNPPALWGYYLGVFSLVPCLGLPLGIAAIACGVAGNRRIARQPGLPGRAHAIVAIVLGLISTLANAGVLTWVLTSADI